MEEAVGTFILPCWAHQDSSSVLLCLMTQAWSAGVREMSGGRELGSWYLSIVIRPLPSSSLNPQRSLNSSVFSAEYPRPVPQWTERSRPPLEEEGRSAGLITSYPQSVAPLARKVRLLTLEVSRVQAVTFTMDKLGMPKTFPVSTTSSVLQTLHDTAVVRYYAEKLQSKPRETKGCRSPPETKHQREPCPVESHMCLSPPPTPSSCDNTGEILSQ